jgi:hypothetical protein
MRKGFSKGITAKIRYFFFKCDILTGWILLEGLQNQTLLSVFTSADGFYNLRMVSCYDIKED